MSTSPRESHTSDTEGGERPLRERLRNATIKGALQPTDTPATSQPATETARATLHRKRSHEDVESVQDEPAQKIRQARKNKRSRDNSPEDKLADHSTKRKSDEIERDVAPVAVHVDQSTMSSAFTAPATEVNDLTKSDESPKSKRSRVEDKTSANTASEAASSTEEAQIPSVIQISTGSGFGNTSAASPFASLAASKSPSEQPSNNTSAFATSAFGALASSSTSAFGALGQTKNLSSFASPTSTPAPGEDSAKPAPTASIFGGTPSTTLSFATAGSSGFGSGASGFGKLGNGFGGLGGSKLTSFASSGTPGVIGGGAAKSSARAFGAPADDDDEEQSGDDEDGDAEVKSPKPLVDEDKKDDRFFEQDSETSYLPKTSWIASQY
jgi:Ran-binding protein 3